MKKGEKMSAEQKRKISNANRGIWLEKRCKTCGKTFYIPSYRNIAKYCSLSCNPQVFKKGSTPWNKDKKCPEMSGENNYFYGKFFKGEKNPSWQGGKLQDQWGYILIYKPNHPFRGSRPYIREHRLVMEEHLGRYLLPEERVHHRNGIRDDNRIENLMYFPNASEHQKFHNWLKPKIIKVCPVCKKHFKVVKSHKKAKYCSKKCYGITCRKGFSKSQC